MNDSRLEIVLAARDITGDTFEKVQSGIAGLGKSIVSVNGMIAGFAGATGLGMIVKSSIDAIAELDRLSTMAGVTAASFQELAFAAGGYQISQDALTDGLKELSLRGADFVRDGAGPAKGAFEALGYSAENLNSMLKDTPALLVDLVSRMENLDKASQIKFADELFGGTGGEQFVAMIQGGADALDTMRRSAHDLGIVIDDDLVKQSVEAKKTVEQLSSVISAQFTATVAELAPDIADMATNILDWVKANRGLISQGLGTVVHEIGNAFDFAAEAAEKTSSAVEKLVGWYEKMPKGWLSKFIDAQYADGKDINKFIESINNGTFADGVQIVTRKKNEQTEGYDKYINKGVDPAVDANNRIVTSFSALSQAATALLDANLAGWFDEIDLASERYVELFKEGARVTDEMRKPTEQLADETDRLNELFSVGAINAETYARAISNAEDEIKGGMVDTDLEAFFGDIDAAQDDLIAAQKDLSEETIKIQKSTIQAQQDAYDDLYGTVKDYTRDVIDDFDSMGNTLVDLAENMAKDIAAAFLTENIVMPITMAVGSSIGLTGSGGVPYSAMGGGGGINGLSLLSNANTGYNALSGGLSSSVGNFLGTGMVNDIGAGLFGASTWGGVAAPSYLTGAGGSMISVNSGLAGGALSGGGMSGIVGGLSAASPYLAAAAIALPLITSMFEDDPEPRIGIRKGDLSSFGFNAHTQDVGGESEIKSYITDYYENYFKAIDEVTANSVSDVLNNTDWERLRVHPEDYDSIEDAVFALNDTVFKKFSDGFISGLAGGQLDGYLDEAFFDDIKDDNESLLDSFVRFGGVIETTDGFVSQFTSQMDDLGVSAVDAFENVSVITSALEEVSTSIDGIATVSAVATLNELTESWDSLIESLETANATSEQIAGAESGMAKVLGANITGLTADTLQSTLMSGGDVDSIIKSSIQSAAYADIAQKIADGYVSGINEEIGQVWIDTGGDIEAVVEAMRNIDTTSAQSEISELQDAFELIEEAVETTTETLISTAEASRLVTMAIDGQLSASQQFQEWQIENIQAMNLFSEITANGVTQSELEGAVDAFADLGIAGDDLNNVIGDLANRFTDASDDLVASLSSITSAQGNLSSTLGDETAAETLESLQSQFKNFQSWSEILGSETVTKQVIVDPTTADYENLVNELFNTMFGRDAASAGLDYWVGALKDASDGVDYTNIMQSLLDGAKASAKSGNLLSAKDLLYYAAAQPTIKDVNPLESTYEEQTSTISGSISSELESSIYDTIDALDALPVLVTDGIVNESNIADWVDVISNANNEALNRLFGEDSETMINSLANAIDDYNAITETASDTTNSLTKAIDNTQELMDDYISYLETEIDTRQDALDSATSVLEDYIEGEEALIDARKAASEDINDFINDLYGSTSSPVQSLEFFEKRYSQLLQDAKNSDADGVGDAVSNLTSFASEYLDFAGSYGGGDNYNDLFNSVVGDLSEFGNLQNITAMAQSRDLKDVSDLLGDSNDELIDINEAIREFRDAELAVDDNVWMTEELEKLGAIDDNLSLLLDAQTAYYNKIGESVPDSAKFNATGSNILQGTIDELGIGLNDLVFGTLSARLQQSIDAGTYSDLFASMVMSSSISQIAQSGIGLSDLTSTIGNVSDDYQFAEGGIISGPMSGYQMPSATFHGTEAIIPLSNGSIPVQIQTPQNVNVQVFIDGKEVKSSVIKTIRTDPEAQTQIRRVANG